MAIIGSCLLSPEATWEAASVVSPSDFYLPQHQIIFTSILTVISTNIPLDILTLSDVLKRDGKLEAVGGATYIAYCMDEVPSARNVQQYATQVLECSVWRQLITLGQEVGNRAKGRESARDLLSWIQNKLINMSFDKNKSEPQRLRDLLQNVEGIIMEERDSMEDLRIAFGFPEIDRATAGFNYGDLVVIGGAPSQGKSALAMQVCMTCAKNQVPCAFFSLEMTNKQIVKRIISHESGISMRDVRKNGLSETGWQTIFTAANTLYDREIIIDDNSSMSLYDFQVRARQLKFKYNVEVIVIDYLQLMQFPNRENRANAVGDVIKGLKVCAKELNVGMIVASQLSRPANTKESAPPTLSRLRESGDIEASADIVIFPYRKDEEFTQAKLIVAKDRNHGGTGSWNAALDFPRSKFIMEGHVDFDSVWGAQTKSALMELREVKDMPEDAVQQPIAQVEEVIDRFENGF